MENRTSLSSSRSSRPTYSCVRCADRKVKCDRQRPCGACVKHHVECVFDLSQPPRRKREKVIPNQVLIDRIKHYEAILQEHGIAPDEPPDTPVSETGQAILKSQVILDLDRSKLIDNLWSRLNEELPDPEDVLEASSSDQEFSDAGFDYVLTRESVFEAKAPHPSSDEIHKLCQIYIENVDPLTKGVHVPTLRVATGKAASNIEAVPRSFEALLFAMYSMAVVSLNDNDCKEILGEHRKVLLSRYISATKIALSKANFMSTINFVVLQALVLHILSVRDIYEPRAVWSLTGVALRIAQSMGLERDGLSMGLPPFEIEMRRRVWWLLKGHDFRTAELCGLAKFRDLDMTGDSTRWPTNVNDDQLYPSMTSLPIESNAMTDTVYIAFKYELANFVAARMARFRQRGMNPNQYDLRATGKDKAEIDQALRQIEESIETKYIRYCDPSRPLQLMTMLAARSAMNFIRFLVHHPRKWVNIEDTPPSERQMVFEISLKLVEQHNMLQSNPQLKQFAWHAPYFLQWHPFIHVLDVLRASPLTKGYENAWQLVENMFENNPAMISDTRKPVHIAVGQLCLKAYSAREGALENGANILLPTPLFILKLREQRATIQARKDAREAKSNQTETAVNDRRSSTAVTSSTDTSEPTRFLHPSNSLDLMQTEETAVKNDPMRFVNGLDSNRVGNSNSSDAMNIDLDPMPAPGYDMDDPASQAAFWEQWDTLLTEPNVLPLWSQEEKNTFMFDM